MFTVDEPVKYPLMVGRGGGVIRSVEMILLCLQIPFKLYSQ